ncbi:MAG: hypothetical protein WA603_06770, partial [Candidatus Acidiferrales bacterium]
PYSMPAWNAHRKDALEEYLHQLVCAGKLDLPTAQHDIATNWIAAYKKYFHTNAPVSTDSKLTPSIEAPDGARNRAVLPPVAQHRTTHRRTSESLVALLLSGFFWSGKCA